MGYFGSHKKTRRALATAGLLGVGSQLLERGRHVLDSGSHYLHDLSDRGHDYYDRGRGYARSHASSGRKYARQQSNALWAKRPWHHEPEPRPSLLTTIVGLVLVGVAAGLVLHWFLGHRDNHRNDGNGGGSDPVAGPRPQGGMRLTKPGSGETVHAVNPSTGASESVHVGRGVVRRK